jgi:X-X-X-Leu-X-X-Gly heptad repeat protein
MNLQTKFIAALAATILTISAITEALRQRHDRSALGELSRANLARLESATHQNALNLQAALDATLHQSMSQGDMDGLSNILRNLGKVEGLLECSLIGTNGRVNYSSSASALARPLEASLARSILAGGQSLDRQTGEALEIFRPVLAEESCLQCHEWRVGSVGGVLLLRVSTAALRRANEEWSTSAAAMSRASLTGGLSASAGIVIGLVLLVALLFRRLLTRPLADVVDALGALKDGELTTRLGENRRDEIGELARHFNAFVRDLEAKIRQVTGGAESLSSSAGDLSSVSHRLASGAGQPPINPPWSPRPRRR